jgi:[ribosomal protein S5]-alanine N-acetyltransferase
VADLPSSIGTLGTERLFLLRMRAEDADDVVAMQHDDRFVEVFGHRSSEEHVRAGVARTVGHWDRLGYGLWTLRDRESGAFVGRGGIQPVTIDGVDEMELGYALRPEWWGRGLATEVSRAALELAFGRLELPHVVAFTMPTNVRSRHVMEKLAFRYERAIVWSEQPHVLYRLTGDVWRADHSPR